ncbi:hypothetical protein PVL29_014079 [Vitis rotundifolia]|uniref:PRA1 family protein n=1 Tax=Vitis rotundifolia TaxID=103349 RepID=A0AA38ZFN7_VITRO|nr:hypothetical protein PVL29_014079 [Vitis rotundifolia]
MTTYGTIPAGTPVSSSLGYISFARERIRSSLGTRRPWKEMVQLRSLSIPANAAEAFQRIRTNAAYFRMNYVIVILFILFLSLLWHPISLIVFVVTMAAWLFLYFLRDGPVVILGRSIDDRVVMAVLAVVTIVLLFLTDVTINILVSLLIGVVVVLTHSVVRMTEDLFVDGEDGARLRLRDAASSSFSTS